MNRMQFKSNPEINWHIHLWKLPSSHYEQASFFWLFWMWKTKSNEYKYEFITSPNINRSYDIKLIQETVICSTFFSVIIVNIQIVRLSLGSEVKIQTWYVTLLTPSNYWVNC